MVRTEVGRLQTTDTAGDNTRHFKQIRSWLTQSEYLSEEYYTSVLSAWH